MRHLFFFIIFSLPSSYIHRESPPFFLTWGRESNTFHVVLFVPLPNDNPHSSDFFPPPLYIVWTILFHSQFLYVHTRVYAFQQYTLIRMWSKGPFFSYLPCRLFFCWERENIFYGSSTPPLGSSSPSRPIYRCQHTFQSSISGIFSLVGNPCLFPAASFPLYTHDIPVFYQNSTIKIIFFKDETLILAIVWTLRIKGL